MPTSSYIRYMHDFNKANAKSFVKIRWLIIVASNHYVVMDKSYALLSSHFTKHWEIRTVQTSSWLSVPKLAGSFPIHNYQARICLVIHPKLLPTWAFLWWQSPPWSPRPGLLLSLQGSRQLQQCHQPGCQWLCLVTNCRHCPTAPPAGLGLVRCNNCELTVLSKLINV